MDEVNPKVKAYFEVSSLTRFEQHKPEQWAAVLKMVRNDNTEVNILGSSKEAVFVNSNDIRCKQVQGVMRS